MTQKNDLVDAHILLRCSEPSHTNCTALQDLLLDNFINITDSSTIETASDTRYCVFAKAKVNPQKIKLFEKRLLKLKKGDLKVSELRIDTVLTHQ
ncbi:MAG: hypothetical protein EB828_05795 [Nitrosopumilus sp. D6]|nr:MAG: hypothetical protein EB828_05795 [Nitrosopumilus sp. D6]